MLKAILLTTLAVTCYWGYTNYNSYPVERKPSPCHKKEKDDLHRFYNKWNPVGRQKPIFKHKWQWGI